MAETHGNHGFDLVFRRKASAVGDAHTSADDRKALAALDFKYQAAVKENDAATMETILADDFALVTGSGKVYTKADLLAEARSGRVRYERQDDTQQTVRIWGRYRGDHRLVDRNRIRRRQTIRLQPLVQ